MNLDTAWKTRAEKQMPAIPELTRAALVRLEKVVDDENAALSVFNSRNLTEFSRVKSQCLLELQRTLVPEFRRQLSCVIAFRCFGTSWSSIAGFFPCISKLRRRSPP